MFLLCIPHHSRLCATLSGVAGLDWAFIPDNINLIIHLLLTDFFSLLTESNIGSYLTGGYGTISEGYWWSTGSLVPYDGQELNQPGQPVCIILTAKTRTVRDEDCHQWPYVCGQLCKHK